MAKVPTILLLSLIAVLVAALVGGLAEEDALSPPSLRAGEGDLSEGRMLIAGSEDDEDQEHAMDSENDELGDTRDLEQEEDEDESENRKLAANPWYIIVKKKLSWHDAEAYCLHKYGTHLATILTRHDLNAIYKLWKKIHYRSFWIGLYEDGDSRHGHLDRDGWFWVSGAPYHQQNYWRHGEPNKHFEKCVYFFGKKRAKAWDDAKCHLRYEFACDSPNHHGP